jgi:hypothetical protein
MGSAFLAEKKLYFIMKLFHFVCERRLLNWLLILMLQPGEKILWLLLSALNSGFPHHILCHSGLKWSPAFRSGQNVELGHSGITTTTLAVLAAINLLSRCPANFTGGQQ